MTRDMKHEPEYTRSRKIISFAKLFLLAGIIIGVPILLYQTNPDVLSHFNSPESIHLFLERYHTASIFVFMGLQIIQIVISVLPGQVLQFAAGYAYSVWLAYFLAMCGIFLGTVLTFYLAKLLGKDAMHILFGKEKINYFITLLNSKKAYILIFVLYVMPGFPKDLIAYAAGISEIKLRPYLILSLVGRSPALLGTIFMGNMTRTGSYFGLIMLLLLSAVLFVLCITKRKNLIRISDKIYDYLTHPKHKKERNVSL